MAPHPNNEIIIAVMGVTGSGKSSLIQQITGDPAVEVSHSLSSCTSKVTPYTFQHNGADITLVDTPGFSDTIRSDIEVLRDISTWAVETYAKGHLTGVLYLHRISDNRIDGSAVRSLRLLKSLVGEKNMKNVLLATTHWCNVTQEIGEKREKELRETDGVWKGLLDHGATLARYTGDRQSGLELLHRLVPSDLSVLDIQDELADQGIELAQTSAGKSVIEDLRRMQEEHEKEIIKLRYEIREAIAAMDTKLKVSLEQEQRELARKIEQLRADQRKLSKAGSPARTLLNINELRLLPNREALLIYVKATLEVGNVGLSGSFLSSMLDPHLRSRLAIQGVYYSQLTSFFSVLSGGSRKATQGVLGAVREGIGCSPKKKIFLCGYSQGAMIIRRALSELKDAERARISGLVFFGDLTKLGLKVPRILQDRLLDIRLPFDMLRLSMPLPKVTYRCLEVAFPQIIEFIKKKMD